MERGKFIVFEGIDGSGKSTQIRFLAETLQERGLSPFVTREPTDGAVGKLIRECLAGRTALDEQAIAALFVADRLDHIFCENGLKEHIGRGELVICDRYYLSSYAYHGAFMPMDWVIDANRLAADALRPDLTVFIDIEPERALERVMRRKEVERYEKLESLRRVREKYLEAIERVKDGERIAVVKSDDDKQVTRRAILSEAEKIL